MLALGDFRPAERGTWVLKRGLFVDLLLKLKIFHSPRNRETVFIPVTRRVKGYILVVGKYITGGGSVSDPIRGLLYGLILNKKNNNTGLILKMRIFLFKNGFMFFQSILQQDTYTFACAQNNF